MPVSANATKMLACIDGASTTIFFQPKTCVQRKDWRIAGERLILSKLAINEILGPPLSVKIASKLLLMVQDSKVKNLFSLEWSKAHAMPMPLHCGTCMREETDFADYRLVEFHWLSFMLMTQHGCSFLEIHREMIVSTVVSPPEEQQSIKLKSSDPLLEPITAERGHMHGNGLNKNMCPEQKYPADFLFMVGCNLCITGRVAASCLPQPILPTNCLFDASVLHFASNVSNADTSVSATLLDAMANKLKPQ